NGIVTMTAGAKGALSDFTNTLSPVYTGLTSFINTNDPTPPTKPKAYLNWMLLDEQFKYVSSYPQSGAVPVATAGTNGGVLQSPLGYTGIPITKNGYLYIWVSNETPAWDVFFDNLSVVHRPGPLLEETHYYPFGLTMAGISSKALKPNYSENKYRYNKGSELHNKEFSDGSGLEMYETHFRSLDPQIGRFWQLDPRPDLAESPYAAMRDDPILINDPLGDTTIVDKTGYITSQHGKDNLVFLQKGKKLINIGELGKTINANKIFKNLLAKNIAYAKGIINPITFRNLVKNKGEWDLKNNTKTIFGLAHSFDKGKETQTQFSFQGKQYDTEELGNFHYGATGSATWFGSDYILLHEAGLGQIAAGTSKPEWQQYRTVVGRYGMTTKVALPPYGDDPHDQDMIKEGIKYYNSNKNTKEED
ncbi:MAG TPA: polymorphic toxin type 44 domain-containing protein, partial [Puia sp.]|nr:polymorphic toxin type 44 domain-containing protein [Puia sp.]